MDGVLGRIKPSQPCQECIAGQHQALPESERCQLCVKGRYVHVEGSSAVACIRCTAGQHQVLPGSSQCDLCAKGRHMKVAGSSAEVCIACRAGQESSTARDSCQNCTPGLYATLQNVTSGAGCVQCDPGTASFSAGGTACSDCGAGQFSGAGKHVCDKCRPGRYNAKQRQHSCSQCEPGTYQDTVAATTCIGCTTGRANGQPGQAKNASCAVCGGGTFARSRKMAVCSPCAKGTASSSIGRKRRCTECTPGKFQAVAGRKSCDMCPANTNTLISGVQFRSECLECTPPDACLGGGRCDKAYRGPMCSFCAKGFFKMKDVCTECPANGTLLSILASIFFIMFAFVVLGLAGGNSHKQHSSALKNMQLRMSVPFTIMICRFQINVEFFNIDLQWPPFLKQFWNWIDVSLNFDFGVVIAPECNFEFEDPSEAFVMRHMAMACVLPAMCATLVVAYTIHLLIDKLRESSNPNFVPRGLNVVNPMVAMWCITFISSCKLVFRSFDCTEGKGASRISTLDALPVIGCSLGDSRFVKVALTGVVVFFCNIVTVPACIYYILHTTDKADRRVQANLGWVFLRYHPKRWYYEMLLMITRASTAAITVFLGSKENMLNALCANGFVTVCSIL